jgi:hypothetical protein
MAADWDDTEERLLLDDASLKAVKIPTERTAMDARTLIPVAKPGRYSPPGHYRRNPTGDSWPPGTMKRSVHTRYRKNVLGKPVGQVRAIWQAVFLRGTDPFLTALLRQRGRSIP